MISREERGAVTVLAIEHGSVNAMDLELCQELTNALGRADGPIVLTGTPRAFSAGVDLRRLLDGGTGYVREFLPALDELFRTAYSLTVPVVAAVTSHAIAGGAVLAAAADRVLMAEGRGRFGVPELKVGVAFPQSALEILRYRIGGVATRRIVIDATTYTPAEARLIGLVDEVLDAEDLIDHAVAVAADLAASAPSDAFALTKTQLRQDGTERIARSDPSEVLAMWCQRVQDGWTANYLAQATAKR